MIPIFNALSQFSNRFNKQCILVSNQLTINDFHQIFVKHESRDLGRFLLNMNPEILEDFPKIPKSIQIPEYGNSEYMQQLWYTVSCTPRVNSQIIVDTELKLILTVTFIIIMIFWLRLSYDRMRDFPKPSVKNIQLLLK